MACLGMCKHAFLLHFSFLLFIWGFLLPAVSANTEKVIFSAPDAAPIRLSNKVNTISALSADAKSEKLLLRIELPRAFPTSESPRGVDSWVYLGGLKPGARYEARICWAATTPSDFWLSVHSGSDDPPFLSEKLDEKLESSIGAIEPHLYLKISAIASYVTTNATLMESPEPVLVDIILDEFLLGVLPRSLLIIAIFIVIMVGVAWYIGNVALMFVSNISSKQVKGKAD